MRECLWTVSGSDQVYGSLYAPWPKEPSQGVLVLPHWGRDGRYLLEWCHRLALGVARNGGCALLLHWPGTEDSERRGGATGYDDLVLAALSTLGRGRERFPSLSWSLSGVRLGGTVAALALGASDAAGAVLVEPELDPQAYLRERERRARASYVRGYPHLGWGFYEKVPSQLRDPMSREVIYDSLATARCPLTVVRYAGPAPAELPSNVRDRRVPGHRVYSTDHRRLRWETLRALRRPAKAAS